MVNHLKP